MVTWWFVRRAVPWTSVVPGLAAGAVLVAAGHRWDSLSAPALPLVVLLAAAGSAFVQDDQARSVVAVTPRGARWAPARRLAVGWAPGLVAAALVALAPGAFGRGWSLVVAATIALTLALALVGAAQQVARPGAAVAGAVVLLGLVPVTVGPFLQLPDLYPHPDLTAAATRTWLALLLASSAATAWLLIAHPHSLRRPRWS